MLGVESFLHGKTFLQIEIDHAAVTRADETVRLALGENLDGVIAHARCHDAVARGRRAAALDVTENRHTRVKPDGFVNLLADFNRAACTLGDDDHIVCLAAQARTADTVDDVVLKVELLFRHQNGRCARCQTDIQRQMPCVSAHDLDDRAALVGLHGIAQTVDCLHGGICRGVVADGVVGADDVVVDRRRDADDADALLGKLLKTTERAVAADADNAVQPQKLAGCRCALLPVQGAEFFALAV